MSAVWDLLKPRLSRFGLFTGDYNLLIGNHTLTLPAEFPLKAYKNRFRMYDRFLPFLAETMNAGEQVIDVGAHSGDTLASMHSSNDQLEFVCIDADDTFYSYLLRNVEAIKRASPNSKIECIKSFIGKEVDNVVLEGHGTRYAAPPEDSTGKKVHRSISLDAIASEMSLTKIKLIKSDVDGFDYDIMLSAAQIMEHQGPALFFECDVRNLDQMFGYFRLIEVLKDLGYQKFAIFDNFGALMSTSSSSNDVRDLIQYTCDIYQKKTKRTLYFIDVLAYKVQHPAVDAALSNYRQFQSF